MPSQVTNLFQHSSGHYEKNGNDLLQGKLFILTHKKSITPQAAVFVATFVQFHKK